MTMGLPLPTFLSAKTALGRPATVTVSPTRGVTLAVPLTGALVVAS